MSAGEETDRLERAVREADERVAAHRAVCARCGDPRLWDCELGLALRAELDSRYDRLQRRYWQREFDAGDAWCSGSGT